MNREARQDKTRSPAPNELARLYEIERASELAINDLEFRLAVQQKDLRKVRAAIKRACGDSGAKI